MNQYLYTGPYSNEKTSSKVFSLGQPLHEQVPIVTTRHYQKLTKSTDCCAGYIWNEKKSICQECSLGYVGFGCDKKCPYPSFGKGCQFICNCTIEECSFNLGCKKNAGKYFR
ncbi:uncharacterized protein LOC134279165 [Saccostrea cucullata]|uniref:uncharacterized protein LOC134279165 n=1 Tax=Saccostrea cuccullata TaxID=36930 RepID=UPI002ED1C794